MQIWFPAKNLLSLPYFLFPEKKQHRLSPVWWHRSPGTGNTVKIGDSLRVTISASGEEELTANSLSINEKTIPNSSLEDISGGDYRFYYVISSGDTDRSDASVIPFSFELKDGSGNVSDAYTESSVIADDCPGIDANKSEISAIEFFPSSTVQGINDEIDVVITAGESGLLGNSLTINNVEIPNVELIDSLDGRYGFTYTISPGETDIADSEAIPVNFVMEDAAGNLSEAFTTSTAADCPGIDANKPGISGVSFSPGSGTVLGIDSTIVITVTAANLENDLTANTLAINSQPIATGTVTNNGDGTYSFPYVVGEGDGDIADSSPVPVNIIMEDAAANVSAAYNSVSASASPGIDATKPEITGVVFSPGTGNTVKIGDSLRGTISASGGEEGLTANSLTINGKTIPNSSLEDISGGEYTFYYVISSGDTDRSDASVIPFSFELKDGSGNVSDPYTDGSVTANDCPGIDANKPEISAIEFFPSSAVQGINDEIDVVITAGETGLTAASLTINDVTIPPGVLADSLDGRYGFTYTISPGDTDIADSEAIPVDFVVEDAAGNLSEAFTTSTAADCPGIDANRPGIKSVIFTPGNGNTSIIGENIRVDVTAENNETGLTAATFQVNNIDISGLFTEDGGGNYHATYTVAPGNADINDTDKLPVTIELSDGANLSFTFTEGDISVDNSPGVDANSPEINNISSSAASAGLLKVNDNILFTIEPVIP